MSGQSAHSAPAPESEEEQEEQGLEENKRQKELDNILQEELPELQQGEFAAEILGGLSLLKLKRYQDKATAFETLKDPKLTDNLFDFEHPENLQQARSSVRVADRELRKKESINKGRAETRFLFWKQDLTPQQFRRAVFETVVARRVDRIVNTEERNIRFRNAVKIYGISDETQFSTSIQQWLKNNPGRNLDDAYAAVGAQFTGLDKDGAKKKKRVLEEEQKKARSQALANKKEVIARGKKIASGFHDGTKDTTLRNLSEGFEFTEKGVSPTVPQPTVQPTLQPQPAAAPTPPAKVVQQPVISKIPTKFTLPSLDIKSRIANFLAKSAALQAFRVAMRNAIAYSLKALRSVGLRSVAKLGLHFARSSLSFLFKTGSQLAIKAGLTAVGAAASLGTTLLAQAGLELFKKIPGVGKIAQAFDDALMGTIKWLAIGAVGIVVGIFIFIIIGANSLFSTNTASNPMIIPQTAQSQTQIYSWKEFEEKYLTTAYSP